MIATDTTTSSAKIIGLIDRLDGILDDIGGYSMDIIHYDFRPGRHSVKVTIFRETHELAQTAVDALGVKFTQDSNPEWKFRYVAVSDGIEWAFHLRKDLEDYPEIIAPRTGGNGA